MNEPSDRARELIRRYRGSIGPSESQRDALVRSVVARVDSGGAGPGTGGASGGGVPWLTIVAAFVLVGSAAWWSARAPGPSRAEPALVRMTAIEPRVEPTKKDARELAVGEAQPASAEVNVAALAVAPSEPVPAQRARPRERTRVAIDAPAAPSVADAASAAPVAAAPALVDEEVRLLREGNLALRDGDVDRARARFDEHARRFADGELVELREVGRALLRCRAEPSEAGATIDGFAARFPGSPHLGRLGRECPRGDP